MHGLVPLENERMQPVRKSKEVRVIPQQDSDTKGLKRQTAGDYRCRFLNIYGIFTTGRIPNK